MIFKHKYAYFLKDKEAEAGKTIELVSEDSKNLVKGIQEITEEELDL